MSVFKSVCACVHRIVCVWEYVCMRVCVGVCKFVCVSV